MSFDQESFHGQSNLSWDDNESVKVPKWTLIFGAISVLIGSIVSLVSFLVKIDKIGVFQVNEIWGLTGYFLTLVVPALLIVYMRGYHRRNSKENADSYDSYSGEILAKKLKNVALVGMVFALLAIYVIAVRFAESGV